MPYTPSLFLLPPFLSPFHNKSLLPSCPSSSFVASPYFHLFPSLFLSFLLLFSHSLFYTILHQLHFPFVLSAPLSGLFSFFFTQIFGYKYPQSIYLRIGAFSPLPRILLLFLRLFALPILVNFS